MNCPVCGKTLEKRQKLCSQKCRFEYVMKHDLNPEVETLERYRRPLEEWVFGWENLSDEEKQVYRDFLSGTLPRKAEKSFD